MNNLKNIPKASMLSGYFIVKWCIINKREKRILHERKSKNE